MTYEQVLARAHSAAEPVAGTPASVRTSWLEAVATALEKHVEELVATTDEETGLGPTRLGGELARTAANMRYYAASGEVIQSTHSQTPDFDLWLTRLPVGPVAVFGASNFPYQFGTLGHDTCSAIAAGCPVVVKAHPAHPRTAARLAEIATEALVAAGAPEGVFGQIEGFDAGLALVDDPRIAAVGFTGSQTAGMALVERAARRDRPIPVFAEMGTVNPVVIAPSAAGRTTELAAGFTDSFTLGTGQFCTKPGLLLAPSGARWPEAIAAEVSQRSATSLLTTGIAEAFVAGTAELVAAGARPLAEGRGSESDVRRPATPVVLTVTPDQLREGSRLLEECFGPVALVCEYADVEEAREVLARLQPSLTASVWAASDDPDLPALVATLAQQVGRVSVDCWPTGVAAVDAMHHGGPWPSTSRPDATSVGAAALQRWTRPVSFQNVPASALPAVLRP